MSRLTQLYVFSEPFSLTEQLQKVTDVFDPKFTSVFRSADLMIINGDRENNLIAPLQIEQVRDLQLEVLSAPLQHPLRIFLLMDIHTASQPAVHSLLKLLEEPPEHVQFVLTTNQLEMVLPTIQSRCQIIYSYSEHVEKKDFSLPESLVNTLANYPRQHIQLTEIFRISEEYKERPKAMELVTNLIQNVHLHQTKQPTSFWTSFLHTALKSLKLLDRNVNTRLVVEELLFTLLPNPQS